VRRLQPEPSLTPMNDLALGEDLDLVFAPHFDLGMDNGLRGAVLHSLIASRAVPPQEAVEAGVTTTGGWWADPYLSETRRDSYGSRLWLLKRAKALGHTPARARDYVRQALAWLIEDGYATESDADVTTFPMSGAGRGLKIDATLRLASGSIFDVTFPWE
jgi:phage gp46-like protein